MTWVDTDYQPLLIYRSQNEADPNIVRRVRALRRLGMSYGQIVAHTNISRRKVIAYCSGRYLGAEYNGVIAA